MTDDAEFALLAAVTARPANRARIRTAACADGGAFDWGRFLRLVERHRVAPLALDGLDRVRDAVPDDVHAALRVAAMRDRSRALQAIGVLAVLTTLLRNAGIEPISIKGPTLALIAFGDPSARQCRDLDILVAPDEVERALSALQTADFRLTTAPELVRPDRLPIWVRTMKDIALVHVPTGTLVELHWRLTTNRRLVSPALAASRRRVTLGTIVATTLGPDDLLLYLCVHGAAHSWFRLKWLADVHALLSAMDPEALTRFLAHARAQGLDIPVRQMLSLVARVYGYVVPPAQAAMVADTLRTRLLAAAALRALRDIDGPSGSRVAATTATLARLLLRRDAGYVAREIASLLVDRPVVTRMGGSRWSYVVATVGRPVFWLARKVRNPAPAAP